MLAVKSNAHIVAQDLDWHVLDDECLDDWIECEITKSHLCNSSPL